MRGFVLLLLTLVVVPTVAEAAPSNRTCAAAYEETQVAMRRSHLVRARESLQTCLDEACPTVLRLDCAGWLKEVEARTPSVVIECTADGVSVRDVRLFVDGELRASGIDGKAMELDPGNHVFRIEAPNAPPVSLNTIVREGEKLKVVRIELPSKKESVFRRGGELTPAQSAPAKEAMTPRRPVPWTVYATAGISGSADKRDLEPCKPECSAAQLSDVRAQFIVADVLLGVTVIALGTATYLFLTRPTFFVPAARTSAALALVPGGAHFAF
jgi:hypothetical protein